MGEEENDSEISVVAKNGESSRVDNQNPSQIINGDGENDQKPRKMVITNKGKKKWGSWVLPGSMFSFFWLMLQFLPKMGKKRKASKHGGDDKKEVESGLDEIHMEDEVVPEETENSAQVDFFDISDMGSSKIENPAATAKRPKKAQKPERICGSTLTGSKIFTEKDEITLLQGKIDCGIFKNVPAPSIRTNVLREYLDGKLSTNFSNTQIYEKIRRLKQKFVKNMKMYENGGGDQGVGFLVNSHEALVFELSKNIWGEEIGMGDNIVVKAKKVKSIEEGELSLVGQSCAKNTNDEVSKVLKKKERMLEDIERVKKKIKVKLQLKELEYDGLKKGN
ncbi:OLC1v1018548C1 [Oldenlandia corymbosa var. corymbosa]|uniref:OLC1v1018548C1 n=1 Tax=Oldenlandia corymbosa var. corymbosa TaxID=529605 RepID=A0AAV1EBW0_OLDCO|nr:OLC1v1018548C1 [Oldenlandia corymbosa var. corymbosa]